MQVGHTVTKKVGNWHLNLCYTFTNIQVAPGAAVSGPTIEVDSVNSRVPPSTDGYGAGYCERSYVYSSYNPPPPLAPTINKEMSFDDGGTWHTYGIQSLVSGVLLWTWPFIAVVLPSRIWVRYTFDNSVAMKNNLVIDGQYVFRRALL